MSKNFTRYAFTESVKKAQTHYGTRRAYARMEEAGEQFRLTARETEFIRERDSFYLASVGENGWPYVQFRGGEKGFLKALDDTTLGYADYRGNGQYISTGNIAANPRVALILMDYPNRQRLKIWAEAGIEDAIDRPDLLQRLQGSAHTGKIERWVTLKIQAFDWNCPRHITPRYTIEEIQSLSNGDQSIANL
jgi:predicted pyridoxine 5'-phosphate oxidase superfamily flavin-nucleotide-binding protein